MLFPKTCFRNVLFSLHLVVHLSLCFLQRFAGRIFFRYFGRTYLFVLLDSVPVSSASPFFCQYWFISYSCIVKLVCCCLFYVFSFHCIFVYFPFFSNLGCSHSFFISSSILTSHPASVFLFGFLCGIPILSLINFVLA